tara:strand:+ start:186 stop:530 length:345 start_codon:yes stop_codon:yes gene_type:complete
MKLENDLMQSLDVLMTKGCIVQNNETELEIQGNTSEQNGLLFLFLQTLYIRLTGYRDNYYLVMIDSVNDFKDYGLDMNACYRRMKSGYQRLLAAGQISFYDCDTREKYTFIFSA